jgi:hypothetical protein
MKHRGRAERALQAMVAVASATKNKEMVARENKLRQEGKLKRYDAAIRNAHDASKYAAKSVQKAPEELLTISSNFGSQFTVISPQSVLKATSDC